MFQVDDRFWTRRSKELLGKLFVDLDIAVNKVHELSNENSRLKDEASELLKQRNNLSIITGEMHRELSKLDPKVAEKFATSDIIKQEARRSRDAEAS